MSEEFKTPPPFVRCDECDGDGYILDDCNSNAMLGELPIDTKCPTCTHSPLPGWLPQYYTPEQYRDWIRHENNLPDYELPDDMPIWVYYDNEWIVFAAYSDYNRTGLDMIIATDAGRPPADWRP